MTIGMVYQKFGVHPNLQRHMLRVTRVVEFISQHWIGEKLDSSLLKKAALVHDLANLIKSDLVNHPEILEEEAVNLEHWKLEQNRLIQMYGNDEHQATEKMLEEIGADSRILAVIEAKSFGNAKETAKSDTWPVKILFYADMRVLPDRIDTMQARLDEFLPRLDKYRNRPDLGELLVACREVEAQIQQVCSVSLDQISDKLMKVDNSDLLESEV